MAIKPTKDVSQKKKNKNKAPTKPLKQPTPVDFPDVSEEDLAPEQNKFLEMRPFASVLLADLVPYAQNAREHTDEQIAEIARSLKTNGWINPVIIDPKNNEIIAGHGRVLAANLLKWEYADVRYVADLSDEAKRLYRIADNQLALKSEWKPAILSAEVKQLKKLGADLTLLGFEPTELSTILAYGHSSPSDEKESTGAPPKGRINIFCLPADLNDMKEFIEQALNENGYAGFTVNAL